jgi:predicted aspartyl protease
MLLHTSLDGAPITALLDSGANHSIVSTAAAARAGVSDETLVHDPGGQSVGVDQYAHAMHQHLFSRLDIGPDHLTGVRLLVGPLQAPGGAEMLLGLDWLRSHRVWIGYRSRTLFLQPAR